MKRFILALSLLGPWAAEAQVMWKQQADTKIDVRLDDNRHMLYAYEELTYTNNSPDTLKFIYIHLWPNAYLHDRTPFAKQQDVNGNTDFYYAKRADRGYIDSLQFAVDGQNVEHYSAENIPDVARIDLPRPLLPGGQVKITTPFKVKLPKVFSRLGHTGQAYFISQWFPKPAVYDRKGWHPISYLDQGEFYSEYGSYDVRITLPANYVVLATGNCMDDRENGWLDSLSRKEILSVTLGDFPESSPEMKTVHFHEDNVHDFAWFADKRYVVRKDTVTSPGTGDIVTTWAAFLPSEKPYGVKLTGYLNDAIRHYGSWVGPYPYKTMKAVFGDMKSGAGMEYPTITVLDKSSRSMLRTAAIHEAGHNWFYGILGSNERDHPWMDEGMNTFYEQKTIRALDKIRGTRKVGFDETLLYYQQATVAEDQPMELPAQRYKKLNYGTDVYYKSGLMLRWLEHYMGEEDFEKGMKDYYNTWRFAHPYPEDFKVCMQRNTAKLIDWFFTDILTTEEKVDYKISSAKVRQNNTVITVQNRTGIKAPALINVYSRDSLTTSLWTEPFSNTARVILPGSEWTRLKVADIIPDAKSTNDVYRRSGPFHRFGIKAGPFAGLNTSEKDKLFIAPALGHNYYDGLMAGLLFHNLTLPENSFRFAVAPLYSFVSNSMVGTGSVGYAWYPRGLFHEVLLQVDAKSFHIAEDRSYDARYGRYVKVAPTLNLTFRERDALSPVTRTLMLRQYNISEQQFVPFDPTFGPSLQTQRHTYGLIRYKHDNNRTYNPFSYSLEGQLGDAFAKLNVEGNIRIDYNKPGKSLYVRGYIGKFFSLTNDPAVAARYYLNSTYQSMNDYLYDGTYRARNVVHTLDARQISAIQEGGFKVPVYNRVGRSDDWMGTLNLKTDLPLGKLPLRLFFDAGLIPNYNQSRTNISARKLLYDGGVELYLNKDIASIYVPVIMSGDFRDNLSTMFGSRNVFWRSISFTLHLHNINWLKLPGKLTKSALK